MKYIPNRELIKAKIVNYLSVMDRRELPLGGIDASCLVDGFDGVDDRKSAHLLLCEMEYDQILEREGNVFMLTNLIEPQ